MIAKGLLLFCLVGLSCGTFLKKKRQLTVIQPLPTLRTAPLYRHEVPEIHEYINQPVIHKVHQPIHLEKYIQPIVHHIYRQPLLKTSVENAAVLPHEHVVQPLQPAVPLVAENNLAFQPAVEAQAHVAV